MSLGDEHGANGAVSRLHANVLLATLPVKVNVAIVLLLGSVGRGFVIVVFGAVRSIVQLNTAGLPSVLPAGSMARTRNVCPPAANTL